MSARSRRRFLGDLALGGAGLLGLGRLRRAIAAAGAGTAPAAGPGYGPLALATDEVTGLPLLKLPEGFRYRTLGWRGSPMDDGVPTPPLPDGMACQARADGKWVLLRNHEIQETRGPIADGVPTYDPDCSGGVTRLVLDPATAEVVGSDVGLAGTVRNCAGGPTPWGSWLTCEESLVGAGAGRRRSHGWVFDVPGEGRATAKPLKALGRRFHEAAVVVPDGSAVYMTEDRETAGLYRFVPAKPGELAGPGVLTMLGVKDQPTFDAGSSQTVGRRLPVTWVPVEDPSRHHYEDGDCLGNFLQGRHAGGARFVRLEGAALRGRTIFFTSTQGGNARSGQVWALHLDAQELELVLESPGRQVMTGPDNLCVSPRGGILVAEDGWGRPQRLHVITPGGEVAPLVESHVVLEGQVHGIAGDFRVTEFAGPCFSPDGKWLFVNAQKAGVTLAITGPWGAGAA